MDEDLEDQVRCSKPPFRAVEHTILLSFYLLLAQLFVLKITPSKATVPKYRNEKHSTQEDQPSQQRLFLLLTSKNHHIFPACSYFSLKTKIQVY